MLPRSVKLTRREAVRRCAVLLGGAPLAAHAMLQAEEKDGKPANDLQSGLIDAHVHVWTPDVKRYPVSAPYTVADMRPPSFTPEQLFAHTRPAGVSRIVLIQMSYYRFDNRYMLDTMRAYPGVFSGVAVVDEHAANVVDTMRELKGQGVRGFRIHPDKLAVPEWIGSPGMARMWKAGADQQLAMCALINPEALTALDKMCERFPETTVVVDHFGRIGVDGTIRDADVAQLCRLARHKKTHVKVSAYYALGQKKSPYRDLGPMIQRLLEAFGPERLMWASDCPFQVDPGHNYRDSIELIRSVLEFQSPEVREWLLRKTAERVFFS